MSAPRHVPFNHLAFELKMSLSPTAYRVVMHPETVADEDLRAVASELYSAMLRMDELREELEGANDIICGRHHLLLRAKLANGAPAQRSVWRAVQGIADDEG